jgi:hypothetical protein
MKLTWPPRTYDAVPWPAEDDAAAFESFIGDGPSDWSIFQIRRDRALSAHGRGEPSHEVMSELNDLQSFAQRWGLKWPLPRIEAALKS